MSYTCDICKEDFYRDEVILLCGDLEVEDEDNGGSGDIDGIFCTECEERLDSILKADNKFKVAHFKRDGRNIDHYETVTLTKVSHYNKDLFLAEFKEWNGLYSMTAGQLENYYNEAIKDMK